MNAFNGDLPGVIRAKGHFWISSTSLSELWPDWVAEFSLAGSLSSIKPLGTWWATVPEERRPKDESAVAYMQAHWNETQRWPCFMQSSQIYSQTSRNSFHRRRN